MVLVKKQQIHRMNISFLKAEKKLVYRVEGALGHNDAREMG